MRVSSMNARSKQEPIPPPDACTIVYTRVSTDDQAKEDRTSLAEQERECRAFAAKRGVAVDYVWSDAGVSGRDEARLERLTRWCEQHPRTAAAPGLIVVLNASRWGRFVANQHASAYFRYRLLRAGWQVEAVQQPTTGNRTTDGVLGVIHDAQAAAESEEKAYRSRMGMKGQAEAGHWMGRAPYGYVRAAKSTTTGRIRKLDAHERSADGERVSLALGPEREVRTVRKMHAWAAKGVSQEEIARRLNTDGVPGPWVRYPLGWRSGRTPQWFTGNVKAILTNPAYVGDLVWSRRAPGEPRGRRQRPRDEWIVVRDAWPALVDRKVFNQVQAIFAARAGQRPARVVRYLLTGMATCVRCGSRLVGGGGTRPKHPDPARFTFYKCPRCSSPRLTLNRGWLEQKVLEVVGEHVRNVVTGGQFDRVLDEVLEAQRAALGQQHRRDPKRELLAAKQQVARLVEAIADGTLTKVEAGATLDDLRRQVARLEAEQHQGRFEQRRQTLTARERRGLKLMALNFSERIAKAEVATARELLGYWIASLYVDQRKRAARLVLRRAPLPAGLAESCGEGRAAGRRRPVRSAPTPRPPTARRTPHVGRRPAGPPAGARSR